MLRTKSLLLLAKSLSLVMLLTPLACELAAEATSPPGWEEFERSARRLSGSHVSYVVEWDLPVTHDELRTYYEQHIAGPEAPRGQGRMASPLIVNRVRGQDDIWPPAERLNLRYCVSNEFGALKSRAVSEMARATAAWEAVADVKFVYAPGNDSNCQSENTDVTFSVRPWDIGGACAFFPSGYGCVPRTLVIDIQGIETSPFFKEYAPYLTTLGVFKHELGHILGFRHEHTRPEAGTCFENKSWRELTPYDPQSTMHYPWCNGVLTADMSLTELDAQGASSLYGWHMHTNDSDRRVAPSPTGVWWSEQETGQSFHVPFPLEITYVDGCFSKGHGPALMRLRSGEGLGGPELVAAAHAKDTGEPCGEGSTATWHRATFHHAELSSGMSYTVTFQPRGKAMGLLLSDQAPYSPGALWDLASGRRQLQDALVRIGRDAR